MPSWDDAERPGQRIQEFIGRYRQRHSKLVKAEKAVIRRAKAADRLVPDGSEDARLAWGAGSLLSLLLRLYAIASS